jgi:antitoxin component YwqK of YwqJK toxin-antitoxin module
LVYRDGLLYPKFSDVPFTGKTTGITQGSFRNGKAHGPWVSYHLNGQIFRKGTFKDGKFEGPWVSYSKDGTVWEKYTGTFRNGVKVK